MNNRETKIHNVIEKERIAKKKVTFSDRPNQSYML